MKNFKYCLKKNNKGMSLVELVCAVAVLGLATTVVGGAVISSAESYQRGTVEVEVQQEAQLVTNLVGNLIVDSADTEYDTTTKTLTVKSNTTTYTIVYNETNDTLVYKEATIDALGNLSEDDGILASEVVAFDVDDSKFDENKSVKVELTVEKGGKEYTAVYNTTARNGELTGGVSVGEYAVINIENEVILEPNQTYSFPVTMTGMSAEQAGGLVWTAPTSGVGTVDATWVGTPDNNGTVLKLGPNAEGTFWFSVKTGNNKKDAEGNETSDPLDYQLVTVKVRRVTDVTISASVVGTPGGAGATYELAGNVAGTYLDKAFGGATYDSNYVSPRPVDFEFAMTGGNVDDYIESATIVRDENSNTPKIKFELKQTLPNSAVITVTATAKHPAGKWTDNGSENVTNKTGVWYDTVTDVYEITKGTSTIDSGIRRGDDYMIPAEYVTTYLGPIEQQCTADLQAMFGPGASADGSWFFRYRAINADGFDPWSKYIKMDQDGTQPKINAAETFLFHPAKPYQIEIILTAHKANGDGTYDLLWPCDTAVLENGRGLADPDGVSVFKQGWTTGETTDYSEYAILLTVSECSVEFYANATYGVTDGTKIVGSKTAPKVMAGSDSAYFGFKVLAMDTGDLQNHFRVDVMKYDSTNATNNWPVVASDVTGTTSYGYTVQVAQPALNINNLNGATGRYCFGVTMLDVPLKTVDTTDSFNPEYTQVDTDCDLYNATSGLVYVRMNGSDN